MIPDHLLQCFCENELEQPRYDPIREFQYLADILAADQRVVFQRIDALRLRAVEHVIFAFEPHLTVREYRLSGEALKYEITPAMEKEVACRRRVRVLRMLPLSGAVRG